MTSPAPTIPPTVAAHVLWHTGNGGYQPGAFVEKLLAAIATADAENLTRLGAGFPEYVAAWTAAARDPDGVTALQRAAGTILRCVHCGDTDGPFAGTTGQPVCEGCIERRPS